MTTVSELARIVTERVDPSSLEPTTVYIGLEHMPIRRRTPTSSGTTQQLGSNVTPFREGDILFGRLRPYLRKTAVANTDGVCSPEILVLRPEREVDRDYLYAYLSSPSCVRDAVRLSAGSRMPRTSGKDLLAMPVPHRTDSVRRTVSSRVRAADELLLALDDELHHAASWYGVHISDRLRGLSEGGTTTLGDLCSIRSGPSWPADDESASPEDATTPVLKITNTRPDGIVDLGETLHVRNLPASVELVGPQTLVMIRTNGNRQRIGNVYVPPAEAEGFAVSAFQFTLQLTEPAEREYVFACLADMETQARISAAASGTTGLGNVAAKWLRTYPIPWPSREIRNEIANASASSRAYREALQVEIAALEGYRDALSLGHTQEDQ